MRLPDGSRLLHIGPHKTGTTTVQTALHHSRAALAERGVHFAGGSAHPIQAAMAASGQALPTLQATDGETRWRELVDEVTASRARITAVSSEFFSDAPAERIDGILQALDPRRTQVVITLRPLCRILPSQWQQYMQNRPSLKYDDALDYEGWLDAILKHPDDGLVTPTFWRRHRHDRLVHDWVDAAGPDHVTVVVVDDADKSRVLRSFEDLLGVPPHTLAAPSLSTNRSLTHAEVEMLRAFNRRYVEQGWGARDYTTFVRFGAVRHLQAQPPTADEPRLLTPQWAVDKAVEINAEIVASIRATGAGIVGDLDRLADPPDARNVGENPANVDVPLAAAARFVAGLVHGVAQVSPRPPSQARQIGEIETAVRQEKRGRESVRNLARTEQRLAERTAELAAFDDSGPTALGILRELAARARRRLMRSSRAGRSGP